MRERGWGRERKGEGEEGGREGGWAFIKHIRNENQMSRLTFSHTGLHMVWESNYSLNAATDTRVNSLSCIRDRI